MAHVRHVLAAGNIKVPTLSTIVTVTVTTQHWTKTALGIVSAEKLWT